MFHTNPDLWSTGCMYKGVYYESHTEWNEPDEPCRAFRCEAGVVTESDIKCHTPCADPLPPAPGQCCQTCPGNIIQCIY